MMLRVENIHKRYRIAGVKTGVLCGVDLSVDRGQICSISGMSGCGKTTLLNVIAGITHPERAGRCISTARGWSMPWTLSLAAAQP